MENLVNLPIKNVKDYLMGYFAADQLSGIKKPEETGYVAFEKLYEKKIKML